jgi:gamma-glutamylcyclotransferase (GGCT)/AIG2-like uncharacterized protein YtfP
MLDKILNHGILSYGAMYAPFWARSACYKEEFTMENRSYYFGYGMNTHPDQMAIRCPDATLVGVAYLDNYRLVFRNHADIEIDTGSSVCGVLWEVSDKDMIALDRLEGFPRYYLRQRVLVETTTESYVAWVYSMEDQDYEMTPSQSYYDMCTAGYKHHGVPTAQLVEAKEAAPSQKYVDTTYDYGYDYFNDQSWERFDNGLDDRYDRYVSQHYGFYDRNLEK